jgi:hypothetical protein
LVTKLAVSDSFGNQSNIFSELRQEAPVGQSTKNLST